MGERSSEGYRASTLAGTAVKCGYLKKYGSNVEIWKRRFFVLKPSTYLYYFLSEEDTKPRGCIDMDMFTHVQHVTRREDEEEDEDDDSSRRAIIEISTGDGTEEEEGGMSFLLEARDADEAAEWVQAINDARFSTLQIERQALRQQHEHFMGEIEALEAQVSELQSYADQRHVAEEALRNEKSLRRKAVQDVEGLYEQVLASLGRAGIKLNTTQINHGNAEAGGSSATAADGVEDAMGLARWSVVEGLRALEAQVKSLRQERDRALEESAALQSVVREREGEVAGLKEQMQRLQALLRKAFTTLTTRARRVEERNVDLLQSYNGLQQHMNQLRDAYTKLKQQKRLLVSELTRMRRPPPPASVEPPEAGASTAAAGGAEGGSMSPVLVPRGGLGDEEEDDEGDEGDRHVVVSSTRSRSAGSQILPGWRPEASKHKDGREDTPSPPPPPPPSSSFSAGLRGGLVKLVQPKIEQLGLIASDSFSRSISIRNLLNLDRPFMPQQQQEAGEETGGEAASPTDGGGSSTRGGWHKVGPWDGEEDDEEDDEEDGRRRVVEYEVEFATKRVGIRFNNVKEKVVAAVYEGPALELQAGGGKGGKEGGGWSLPRVQGAVLVGVNGASVEHLPFNEVTRVLARAGRPIRMRFREKLHWDDDSDSTAAVEEEGVVRED